MNGRGGTIICGPGEFRLQGEARISSSGIEVFNSETRFHIHTEEIDWITRLPPYNVSPNNTSSSNGSLTNRRYLTCYVPPRWFTLVISTKEFLIFEVSVPSRDEQDTIYKALSDYSSWVEPTLNKSAPMGFCATENGWGMFSLQTEFARAIDSKSCRISYANFGFEICPSYPRLVVVPPNISDEILHDAAMERHGCRFPVIKYFHPGKATFLATAGEFKVLPRNSSKANQLADDISQLSFSSTMSISQCRSNEQLLTEMLPTSGRGLIIDIRSIGASGALGSAVSSSKTKKLENRRRRDLSPVVEANRPQKPSHRWSKHLFPRVGDIDQFDQRWKRVAKPLPDLNDIFATFGDFIRDMTKSSLSGSSTSVTATAAAYVLPSILPMSSADGLDDSSSSNGTAPGGKVSTKRTTGWLSLVREALAIAVAGACALDGRDLSARQQLDREKSMIVRTVSGSGEELAELEERLMSMTPQGASVLIVGSGEGRDRCLLISSLIQVILSPEVRTTRGFQGLIQREWVSAGHPFSERCSHLLPPPNRSAEDYKNPLSCPVFLLFLDCVWQIWCQYPGYFEFSEELLLLLVKHVYVSDFGTFVGDCEENREVCKIADRRVSLWSYINSPDVLPGLRNPLYSPAPPEASPDANHCWPCLAAQAIKVWQEVYQRVLLPLPCNIWADKRKALGKAYDEYKSALARLQDLQTMLGSLVKSAVERGVLAEK